MLMDTAFLEATVLSVIPLVVHAVELVPLNVQRATLERI